MKKYEVEYSDDEYGQTMIITAKHPPQIIENGRFVVADTILIEIMGAHFKTVKRLNENHQCTT